MSADACDRIRDLVERGDLDAALREARAALPGLEGEARGQMLLQLSAAHAAAGAVVEALRAAAAAGEVFEACGSRSGRCDLLIRIGNTLRAAGDHASAITALEEAEEIARELADPRRMAKVLRSLGVCCSIIGRHQHALSCLTEALAILDAGGDPIDRMNTRQSLYNAHSRQANALGNGSAEMRAACEPLLAQWQALAGDAAAAGMVRLEAMARGNHAITLHQCGQARAAAVELESLLARYGELGMRPNLALCLSELGRCHAALDEPATARQHLRQAVELLRDGGSLDDLQESLEALSRVEEALGNLAGALAALREARTVDRRKSDEAARHAAVQREMRIELARQTSQWARQANQDPLTGLGNRRALEGWFGEHLPGVEGGARLCLLLMDLDHFKQVNDRFGHDVGDEVLRRVAAIVRRHCRHHDLAVRFGGEEFLLALAGASIEEGVDVGERVRQAIAACDWAAVREGLVVTVSIGVTEAGEVGDGGSAGNAAGSDSAALLTLADQRLYTAKLAGRNRLVAAG